SAISVQGRRLPSVDRGRKGKWQAPLAGSRAPRRRGAPAESVVRSAMGSLRINLVPDIINRSIGIMQANDFPLAAPPGRVPRTAMDVSAMHGIQAVADSGRSGFP